MPKIPNNDGNPIIGDEEPIVCTGLPDCMCPTCVEERKNGEPSEPGDEEPNEEN